MLPILPKDSIVIEEAWNAYPYTKTRLSCPLLEKFSIEMETLYLEDVGEQENVFKLSSQERKNVQVGEWRVTTRFRVLFPLLHVLSLSCVVEEGVAFDSYRLRVALKI